MSEELSAKKAFGAIVTTLLGGVCALAYLGDTSQEMIRKNLTNNVQRVAPSIEQRVIDVDVPETVQTNSYNVPVKNYLENISQMPVKNFNESSSRRYEYVVVHTTGSENIEGVISWFNNPNSNASAHYLVDRDGKIFQTVDEKNVAWHVKPVKGLGYNTRSIGIEMASMPNGTTREQEDAAAQLIVKECETYGITKDHVVGHVQLDPGRKLDPGFETMSRILERIPGDVGTHTTKPKDNHKYKPYIGGKR